MKQSSGVSGWIVLLMVVVVQEMNAMSYEDGGRKLQSFPGICMDCGYFIPNMHCDLSVPCTKSTCRKECVDDSPKVSDENRPSECDISQNRNPMEYECWWDEACADNQRCCITDTGSYCSS